MDQIERKIVQRIEENREQILAFANDIYHHAELGYKEFRTSGKFAEVMKQHLSHVDEHLAVTGVKAYLNEDRKEQFSLALLGEMDALKIPNHIYAVPETGAAHCCGHHAQLAGVVGAMLALTDPEIADKLDGQVIFFATPAEEYGEVEFKKSLMQEGKIQYGGGKCELLRIGAFDDVDAGIAHHIREEGILAGKGSGNGFVSKVITMEEDFFTIVKERRSVREFTDQEVPDELIDKVLEAGLWAAHGCNVQSIRYIVVREKNEPGLFRGSDVPGGPVHLIVLQDMRCYRANSFTPVRNQLLDAGAAAQNMVLAAHAVGLESVWLTFRNKEFSDRMRARFNLPEYMRLVTYVDVGYGDQTPYPPLRWAVKDTVLGRY